MVNLDVVYSQFTGIKTIITIAQIPPPLFRIGLLVLLVTNCHLFGQSWTIAHNANDDSFQRLSKYDVVVTKHGLTFSLSRLRYRKKVIIFRLNLVNVAANRDYQHELKKARAILTPSQKKSAAAAVIDMRNPYWSETILSEIIPRVMHQGFNGILIDNFPQLERLEQQNPRAHRGLIKFAGHLLDLIKQHYPHLQLFVSHSPAVASLALKSIDGILVESLLTRYDVPKKLYLLNPEKNYARQIKTLKALKNKKPTLQIYALEHWNPDDQAFIQQLTFTHQQHGFLPYIAVHPQAPKKKGAI